MKKKLFLFLIFMMFVLSLAGCETVPPTDRETAADKAQNHAEARIPAEGENQAAPSLPMSASGRQEGERYEGVIRLEGMERTVRYEHIVNKTVGFEMDYDYETFARRSEGDRERFLLAWDDPETPAYYLEVTCSSEEAEAVAAAIGEELSDAYEINRGTCELDGAGRCIRIGASEVKGGGYTADPMQMVYIIPTDDGCLIAAAHYGADSSDLFGARFRAMVNTIKVL